MFPSAIDQPFAAAILLGPVGPMRRLGHSNDERLLASVKLWLELDSTNRARMMEAGEEYEKRASHQFLFLYGGCSFNKTAKSEQPNIPTPYAFNPSISNPSLTYSNNNTTVRRIGSVSCYPAAFASIPPNCEQSKFIVELESVPRGSNWLSFGLAKVGLPVSSSGT